MHNSKLANENRHKITSHTNKHTNKQTNKQALSIRMSSNSGHKINFRALCKQLSKTLHFEKEAKWTLLLMRRDGLCLFILLHVGFCNYNFTIVVVGRKKIYLPTGKKCFPSSPSKMKRSIFVNLRRSLKP